MALLNESCIPPTSPHAAAQVLTAGPSLAQLPQGKTGEDDDEETQVAVGDRKRARDKKSKVKRRVSYQR